MCSVFLLLNQIKNIPLAIVSNRDEFHLRETSEIAGWDKDFENPGNVIFAPRDEKRKGTWFGFKGTQTARYGVGGTPTMYKWAILTNIRNPADYKRGLSSRGDIIPLYLNWPKDSSLFLEELKKISQSYNGFNLLFGDSEDIFYFHSKDGTSAKIFSFSEMKDVKKIFGLSNSTLNSQWPKLVRTQNTFSEHFKENSEMNRGDCWDYFKKEMHNKRRYPLSQLPKTGVPEEQEIYLSSLFIDGDIYGTRATLFFGLEEGGDGIAPFFYEQSYVESARPHFDKKIFLKNYA